jgi:hypothetical protein
MLIRSGRERTRPCTPPPSTYLKRNQAWVPLFHPQAGSERRYGVWRLNQGLHSGGKNLDQCIKERLEHVFRVEEWGGQASEKKKQEHRKGVEQHIDTAIRVSPAYVQVAKRDGGGYIVPTVRRCARPLRSLFVVFIVFWGEEACFLEFYSGSLCLW